MALQLAASSISAPRRTFCATRLLHLPVPNIQQRRPPQRRLRRSVVFRENVEVPAKKSMSQFDDQLISPMVKNLVYPFPTLRFIVLSPELYESERDLEGYLVMWIRSVSSDATFVREFFIKGGGSGNKVLAAGVFATAMTPNWSVNYPRFFINEKAFKTAVNSQLANIQEEEVLFETDHFVNRIQPPLAPSLLQQQHRAQRPASTKLVVPAKNIEMHGEAFDQVAEYVVPQGQEYLARVHGGKWRLTGVLFSYFKGVNRGDTLAFDLFEGEPDWGLQHLNPLSLENSLAQLASWPSIRGRCLADYIHCEKVLQHEVRHFWTGVKSCLACTFWKRVESPTLYTKPDLFVEEPAASRS